MRKITILLALLTLGIATQSFAGQQAPWNTVLTQPKRTNWVAPFFYWVNVTNLNNGTFQVETSTSYYVDYCQEGSVAIHQYIKFPVFNGHPPIQYQWLWTYVTYSISIPAYSQYNVDIFTLNPGEDIDGTYVAHDDIQPWPCH